MVTATRYSYLCKEKETSKVQLVLIIHVCVFQNTWYVFPDIIRLIAIVGINFEAFARTYNLRHMVLT